MVRRPISRTIGADVSSALSGMGLSPSGAGERVPFNDIETNMNADLAQRSPDSGAGLRARSNDHYANEAARISGDPTEMEMGGGQYMTRHLMDNATASQSSWAPYFQALQENGVSRVAQDAARPHGIADSPDWQASGDAPRPWGENQTPYPSMNNIASPNPYLGGRVKNALRGLKG